MRVNAGANGLVQLERTIVDRRFPAHALPVRVLVCVRGRLRAFLGMCRGATHVAQGADSDHNR